MATAPPVGAGTPRSRRRAQTREEILDAALDVMREQGVAGLNLTEVARRVGLRQPSLYQYFDSRNAVYDALFERGMLEHERLLTEALAEAPGWAGARAAMTESLRFAAEQPVLAQLCFTRTVPGFEPSEQAYAPSVRAFELVREVLAAAVRRGELRPEAAEEDGVALLMVQVAGIASQQAANDPDAGFEDGRFVRLLEPALAMYEAYYRPRR